MRRSRAYRGEASSKPADLPTLCRGSEVGMLSAIQNAAIADGVSHARKGSDVLLRIGVDDDQICALADCDGSHFSLHSEALCRRGGEHSQNIAHAEAGLLQSLELAFGAVVGHVADVGSEKQLTAELMELPDFVINRL